MWTLLAIHLTTAGEMRQPIENYNTSRQCYEVVEQLSALQPNIEFICVVSF